MAIKAVKTNPFAKGLGERTASNSLAINANEFVTGLGGAYITKSTTGDTIEGVSITTYTFASDNVTVAKAKCQYQPLSAIVDFELAITGGTITIVDEGKFYDINSSQVVDGTTESTTTGQLKLEKFISSTLGRFSIANL